MALTVLAITRAKPTGKTQRLFDGGGMYLEISPSGGKWWRLKYRINGKEKRISLGTFPDTSLADAREKRDAARKLVASGIDPAAQKRQRRAEQVAATLNSFEAVSREWFAKQEPTWVPKHASRIMLRLQNDIFPWLGKLPVADITATDFLGAVNRVAQRGAVESAHRVLQNCGQVMRYAVATGRAARNPVTDLKGALPPVKPSHHAAITDPNSIGPLLRTLDGYRGTFQTKCALKLAPLTFVRPGELRHAEWSEFDLEKAEWNIPAEKMKGKVAHLIPLSPQAVAILRELHPLTGSRRFAFSSTSSGDHPMSENTILAALRRMGIDKEEMSGHGFRAMARTILDEWLHFRPDYIEHQLSHAVRDPHGRAYNRTSHVAERRKMLAIWATYLDELRSGKAAEDAARSAMAIHREVTADRSVQGGNHL